MQIKFNIETIGFINSFESLTNTHVKDCYINNKENVVFVVGVGEAGKAIGKNGVNVKNMSDKLKKVVKIIEFNPDPARFVENAIYPLKCIITLEEGVINIKAGDTKTKGLLIGREQQNLNELKELVSKYFKMDVKVL